MIANGYSESKGKAPSLGQHGRADYLAIRTMLLSHAKAYHVYQNEFRNTQKGSAVYVVEIYIRFEALLIPLVNRDFLTRYGKTCADLRFLAICQQRWVIFFT
jgi:hypothetical protein